MFAKALRQSSSCFAYDLCGDACKVVSDFNRSIPSGELNHVRNKRTSFVSCACTFESSWLVVRAGCHALVTRKLPLFLSRLNEISGGR